MFGAKAGKLLAMKAKAVTKQRGRVDAPGASSTTQHSTAMNILKNRALQGSSGTRLQGSSPSLQLPSNRTIRLQ